MVKLKILSNRRMAPMLTLRLLSLVLFFFMIGQDISARDLKTVIQDQKQFDLNGNITSTEVNETSQPTPNLIFLSDHEEKQSNDPNLLSWGDHEEKQVNDPNETSQPTPNLIFWGDREEKQSNDPNLLSWGHEEKQVNDPNETSQPTPNLIFWGDLEEKQSNDPNLLSWGGHEEKQVNDPNETSQPTPNLIFWGDREEKQSNDPNLLSWGGHEEKQVNDLNETSQPTPNLIFWGDCEEKQSNDPNLLSWGGHEEKQVNDPNETSQPTPNLLSWGGHKDKQPNDPNSLFIYGVQKANSKNLEDHPSSNLDHIEAFKLGFFNLDDLHVGNVMTLQFPVQKIPYFLSKKEADSMPLSLSQLTRVLRLLSIPQDSPQAKSMRKTLAQCEKAVIVKGETRMCVNSLDSMLEFVATIIGSDAKYDILTTSNPSPSAIPLQKYTILEVSHDINAQKWVACHPIPYPYAIYGCHHIATGSKVFKVSLVGDKNGDKMEALGMCHLDTSGWNPDHKLFKTLGIKPAKNSSACHFFPVNHLLWVPLQPSKSTM